MRGGWRMPRPGGRGLGADGKCAAGTITASTRATSSAGAAEVGSPAHAGRPVDGLAGA